MQTPDLGAQAPRPARRTAWLKAYCDGQPAGRRLPRHRAHAAGGCRGHLVDSSSCPNRSRAGDFALETPAHASRRPVVLSSAGVAMADGTSDERLDPRLRWVLGGLAFGLLVTGCVATFVTSNDVGAAALVAGGFGLAALAYLGERITHVKYGEFEADMGAVKKAEALVRAAAVAEGAGESSRADGYRAEALATLDQLSSVGRSYEGIRSSMHAGWERTQQMEEQVAKARRLALENGIDVVQVRELVAHDTEGDRLAALGAMEAVPEARDFDLVLRLVANPKTPFEHYHALRVANEMVPELEEHQRQRLVDIVSGQRKEHRLAKDSDRLILIDSILQRTGNDA